MKEDIPNHRLINRSEIQAPIFPAGLLTSISGLVMIFPQGPSTLIDTSRKEETDQGEENIQRYQSQRNSQKDTCPLFF